METIHRRSHRCGVFNQSKHRSGNPGRLEIAPTDFKQRLLDVYQIQPAGASILLAELVEETYDLVEKHCHQVDVSWLRRVFRYQRSTWDEPPL